MKVVDVVKGAALFLYRFVAGDDPVVAAVMLVALAATAFAVAGRLNAWWLVPPVAVVMTGVSLWRRGAIRRG